MNRSKARVKLLLGAVKGFSPVRPVGDESKSTEGGANPGFKGQHGTELLHHRSREKG